MRSFVAIVALLGAGCAAAPALPEASPDVRLTLLDLDVTGIEVGAGWRLLAAYELTSNDPRFGGFSGIETDGRTLWLLSDRASLWRATIASEPGAAPLRLTDWRVLELSRDDADRRPLDSEALSLSPSGDLLGGFEHDGSVRRLRANDDGSVSSERVTDEGLVDGGSGNAGLEALAVWPDGTLIALSEGERLRPGLAAGAIFEGGVTSPFGYALADGFSPVGAAAAGGRLYVLERAIGVLSGWRSRLTVSPLERMPIEGTLEGEEILHISASPLGENYEGVALLEREGEGRLILLIADDNQSPLQRTLLLVLAEES